MATDVGFPAPTPPIGAPPLIGVGDGEEEGAEDSCSGVGNQMKRIGREQTCRAVHSAQGLHFGRGESDHTRSTDQKQLLLTRIARSETALGQ